MSIRRLLFACTLLQVASIPVGHAADGQLDPGFSEDGWTILNFTIGPEGNDYATSVAALPDGRIVSAGVAMDFGSANRAAVSRHTPAGHPDNSFDGDGRVTFHFAPTSGSQAEVVLVHTDAARIVIVGTSRPTANDVEIGLARVEENGSFDASFGSEDTPGRIAHPLPVGSVAEITAAAIHGAGRILVAGSGSRPGGEGRDSFVVRFLANGELDSFFGDGGIAWLAFDRGGGDNDTLTSLAVDEAGRIVALLRVTTDDGDSDSDTGIVRLDPTGDPDAQFGGAGDLPLGFVRFQLTDVFGATQDNPASVAVQPDGRIVFAGWNSATSDQFRCYVARLLDSGATDPSLAGEIFDLDGEEFVLCNQLVLQSDDRLLVSGLTDSGCFAGRLESDGQAFDPSFGVGGVQRFAPPSGSTTACDAATLSAGRLVLAGSRYLDAGPDAFYVLRLSSALVFSDGFESESRSQWSD